jgi:hypothetical protein
LLAVAVALFGVAGLRGGRAQAGELWCFDDPVVSINGQFIAITNGVFGDPALVRASVSAANVEVHVPKGVSASVVSHTATFFNEPVTFVYDRGTWTPGQRVSVQVKVSFTSTKDLHAASFIVYPRGTIKSTATTRGSMSKDLWLK